VNWEDILAGHGPTRNQIKEALSHQGWFFLNAPELFLERRTRYNEKGEVIPPAEAKLVLNEEIQLLEKFFQHESEVKQSFSERFNFGYSAVDHKDGFHLFTGNRINDHNLPPELKELFKKWATLLDQQMLSMLQIISKPVFDCQPATLAHRADLPVAYSRDSFGFLDIAHYFNNKTVSVPPAIGQSTDEVNCVPHYDPGLFSISFLSTSRGLQLQDPVSGQWFDGPVNLKEGENDMAVIWAGEAAVTASKGAIKAGIHRVIYPEEEAVPRITAWYELCTLSQANEPSDLLESPGYLEFPSFPNSKPLKVEEGDTTHSIFKKIERDYGIPSSKVMRKSDFFRAGFSEDNRPKKNQIRICICSCLFTHIKVE